MNEKLKKLFDLFDDEYLQFEDIQQKDRLSNRPDLHAFLLLDKLLPGTMDIVSAAEHDEIFLDVDPEGLFRVATKEQIRDLIRCGVRFDEESDSFAMFV